MPESPHKFLSSSGHHLLSPSGSQPLSASHAAHVVIGRDFEPAAGLMVARIQGGFNDITHLIKDLKIGNQTGRIVKVVSRKASVSQFSSSLSCSVLWDGEKEPFMSKTGLGGNYDLVLHPEDPQHPGAQTTSNTLTIGAEEIGREETKDSDFWPESPNSTPVKDSAKKGLERTRSGFFKLRRTPSRTTQIEEFNITKSARQLEFEAQKKEEKLSREASSASLKVFK